MEQLTALANFHLNNAPVEESLKSSKKDEIAKVCALKLRLEALCAVFVEYQLKDSTMSGNDCIKLVESILRKLAALQQENSELLQTLQWMHHGM